MRLVSDSWLAGLFGHPVYRVTEAGTADRDPDWDATLHSGSRVFAYARIDTADIRTANELVDAGFHVVEVTVKFTRTPAKVAPLLPVAINVRAAGPADFDRIVEIAGASFKYSRFHMDPLVPQELANEIKRSWMESYRRGTRGSGCLVATIENVVVGFLAIAERRVPEVVRIIDLIGVDQSSRGRGVGRALVDTFTYEAMGRAVRVEAGTQGANTRSIRLYENCGFRVSAAAYALHGHFGSGSALS